MYYSFSVYIIYNCLCLHDSDTSLTEVFPRQVVCGLLPLRGLIDAIKIVVSVMCVTTI
jgi:hypothetical protein